MGPWRLREDTMAYVPERAANLKTGNLPLDFTTIAAVLAMAMAP